MKKSKVADMLYVPIKDGSYLLDTKGKLRIYKSIETLEKYLNKSEYDNIITYVDVLLI